MRSNRASYCRLASIQSMRACSSAVSSPCSRREAAASASSPETFSPMRGGAPGRRPPPGPSNLLPGRRRCGSARRTMRRVGGPAGPLSTMRQARTCSAPRRLIGRRVVEFAEPHATSCGRKAGSVLLVVSGIGCAALLFFRGTTGIAPVAMPPIATGLMPCRARASSSCQSCGPPYFTGTRVSDRAPDGLRVRGREPHAALRPAARGW